MVSIFAVPKPKSMLYFVSLRTAAEFIQFTLLINKVTGFYGILAIFTGYHLNVLQASHYVYSLIVLGLALWLTPSIRRSQEPLRNLALAWIYVLDTIINSIYTGFFSAGWFVLLSQHLNEPVPLSGGNGISVPGKSTMNETAGFTDPEINVTQVDVVAVPSDDLLPGQNAIAYASYQPGSFGSAVLQADSLTSIALLVVFACVRIYFCLIMLSYARRMLRQYIAHESASSTSYTTPVAVSNSEESDPTLADNPFQLGRAKGTGWQGFLGRAMLQLPSKRYWLGRDEQTLTGPSEWERLTNGRFEAAAAAPRGLKIKVPSQPEGGIPERERRARSGTGPPTPSTKVFEK